VDGWKLANLLRQRAEDARPYLEFQRSADMTTGIYVLPAGGVDRQQPHTEDEIYYVVEGRGRITVGDETAAVEPGSLVFVPARRPHRFHDITDELRVLVVFGPAEGSRATRGSTGSEGS
jgi:mannose-6-phosphate isomerase-like protein (cupin superfamily)